MKKVMLILMLVVCGCGCTKKPPKVRQLWQNEYNGNIYEIVEVGEKYVVYKHIEEVDGYVKADTKKDFYEDRKLWRDVEEDINAFTFMIDADAEEDFAIVLGDDGNFHVPPVPKKPHLHKNPGNDHWICSKHGDLTPDYDKDSGFYVIYTSEITVTFYGSQTYCSKCFVETFDLLFNQHITGVKENE